VQAFNTELTKVLIAAIIHTADISTNCMDIEASKRWGDKVLEEFRKQGAEEERRGMPVTSFMANLNTDKEKAKVQFGFVKFVVKVRAGEGGRGVEGRGGEGEGRKGTTEPSLTPPATALVLAHGQLQDVQARGSALEHRRHHQLLRRGDGRRQGKPRWEGMIQTRTGANIEGSRGGRRDRTGRVIWKANAKGKSRFCCCFPNAPEQG
jgi:hypothetical protein